MDILQQGHQVFVEGVIIYGTTKPPRASVFRKSGSTMRTRLIFFAWPTPSGEHGIWFRMALGFWFFDLFPIGQESLGAIFTHMQLFDLFLGKDLGNVHGGRLWTALAAQKDYLGGVQFLIIRLGEAVKKPKKQGSKRKS